MASYGFKSWRFDIWLGHLAGDLTRSAPPGAGGGLTSPRGITAARPPFFILRVVARPLGFIDIGDLKRFDAFWSYALNFSIFPKTTAGPSASEKPYGRMLSIFSFFRKRLPDQVLRKSPVGVLGGSWELLGGF